MRLAFLGCVAAFLTVVVPAQPAAQPLAPGTWVGRAAVGHLVAFAMLNVAGGDSPAVLALPLERKAHPLAMSIRDGRILLESTDGAGLRLEGGVTGGVFAGSTGAGRFELLHVQPADPDALRRYTGFYRAPDQRLLFLFPSSPLGIPPLDVVRRRGSRRCRVSCRRGRLRGRRRLPCALSGTGAHPLRPRGRRPAHRSAVARGRHRARGAARTALRRAARRIP